MADEKKLNEEEFNDINGGSLLCTKEQARACDISLMKADGTPGEFGIIWNTGDYYFNGKKLSQGELRSLLDFYDVKGYPAKSIEEATEYWEKRFKEKF